MNLSYSEVLNYFVENLDKTNLSYDFEDDIEEEKFWLYIRYDIYYIDFYPDDFLYYHTEDGTYCLYRNIFITRDNKIVYININEDCKIKIPETNDEWFNFSVQFSLDKSDFENYLKIVEHLNNEKNKLQRPA